MPVDFQLLKMQKERGVTNDELFEDAKEYMRNFDEIVIVGVDKEGTVETFFTQDSSLSVIGMMEVAKQQLLNEMN